MQQPNQMMDLLKTQMMSMMMMRNINQPNAQSNNGFEMVYMFIATQLIDLIIKYIPIIGQMVYQHYYKQINKTIETKIVNGIKQVVKSSITVTVKMNESDNTTALSIMDYITNNKNTARISYKNKNFVLNQTTEIQITPDINAIMHNSDITVNSEPNNQQQTIIQNIELYSYTLSVNELRAFMDDVRDRFIISQKNKLGNHKYYFNMMSKPAIKTIDGKKDFSRLPPFMSFTMKKFNTNRKFSNIFGEDVATIKDRVKFFINNKAWYDEKGIPYTLGLLLSGNPGTGKTSTIKCLANETKRHIFNINFNNDITKQQLEYLFFNEQIVIEGGMEGVCIPLDQRIYVFEDIDCQNNSESISRTSDGMQTSQIDLSFLLNLLDGVLELPGRIIIMTSNHPEQLDHALIRPGRIDIVANYTNCTNETIVQMIEFFYNQVLDTPTKMVIMELPPLTYTPAEVGKILFEHFGNMDGAIKALKTQIKTKPIVNPVQEKPIQENPIQEKCKPEDKSVQDKHITDMLEKALIAIAPSREPLVPLAEAASRAPLVPLAEAASREPLVPFENNVTSYIPMSLTKANSQYQPYSQFNSIEPLWSQVN
jgi:ATP-dependent 26S proteasome regulatory subunit